MTPKLRVILELGKGGRRVVAGATDWPGLDRWGRDEEAALEAVARYRDRYVPVAARAGLSAALVAQDRVEVIERVPGNTSTDWWGIAHVPSVVEGEILPDADLDRRLALLQACWEFFDDTAASVSAELRPGPRGGGWTREEIIRHVYANEPEQVTRKVEVRTPKAVVLTPDGLAAHREATLDALRAWNREGRRARTWPVQFLIRRIAHHLLDHAWELEDRDLTDR